MNDARIYYSATVITLDGSDLNAAGEPCEPGKGYTERHGYIDPDWSVFEAEDITREQAACDRVPDDERDPARWVADKIRERIGLPEGDGGNHFYAADSVKSEGREAMLCAHVHGMSDGRLAAVWDVLASLQHGE